MSRARFTEPLRLAEMLDSVVTAAGVSRFAIARQVSPEVYAIRWKFNDAALLAQLASPIRETLERAFWCALLHVEPPYSAELFMTPGRDDFDVTREEADFVQFQRWIESQKMLTS